MIDLKKRQTLKTIAATSVASAALALPVVSAAGKSQAMHGNVTFSVQSNRLQDSAYLIVENKGEQTSLQIAANQTIDTPNGVYSLDRIANMGSIDLKGYGSRIFSLDDRVDSVSRNPLNATTLSYKDLRFSVTKGVVTDQIELAGLFKTTRHSVVMA